MLGLFNYERLKNNNVYNRWEAIWKLRDKYLQFEKHRLSKSSSRTFLNFLMVEYIKQFKVKNNYFKRRFILGHSLIRKKMYNKVAPNWDSLINQLNYGIILHN